MKPPQEASSSPSANSQPVFLRQQVDQNRGELVKQYLNTLRQTAFTNRTLVHPSRLESLAAAEADALLAFLHKGQSGTTHGWRSCEAGLSHETVLRLNQATRRFFLAQLDSEKILPALDLLETYLNEIVDGFIQQFNANILEEQEQIRSALQVAVNRYVVEIAEVQSLAQQADEANQFKLQFIARVSHELRTPLGALLGMAEMLSHQIYGPLNPQQQDIVQRIINNAQALKDVFSELLDQSQIESGKLNLRNEQYDPKHLVETVHASYLPLALQKGLTMQVEINSNLPLQAQGDPSRIQQVISNLITNAIKYTERGGISVRSQRANDKEWLVRVKDTGIGISEENEAYIFESFRQVDPTKGWQFGGVGLGLAIVHSLTTAMGGRVTVESKIGRGSTFTVFFPLKMEPVEEAFWIQNPLP